MMVSEKISIKFGMHVHLTYIFCRGDVTRLIVASTVLWMQLLALSHHPYKKYMLNEHAYQILY